MKALFIGGTGTISTQVSALTLQSGWQLILLNRGNTPAPEGARCIAVDIHDEAAVHAALKYETFDVVADFIAYTPEDIARDTRLFAGKTKQFIFISSASAYQKPMRTLPITESTPLVNPYAQYSRNKAACEDVLTQEYRQNGFPITIIRPSHTYSGQSMPLALHGKNGPWQTLLRILEGKRVIIPGDGSALWTITHAHDFAVGFVGLMGNPHAIGTAVHITSDEGMTWNEIYQTLADALGVPLKAMHVASDFLVACEGQYDFSGMLLGDKSSNVQFDNSKIKKLVPQFMARTSMAQGIRECVSYMLAHKETQKPDAEFDEWCDNIILAQDAALEGMGASNEKYL